MKLELIARWAEIIASVAVVVSLIFLTIEVRENTLAVESQAIRDRSQSLNFSFVTSSKVPEILAKIKETDGPEALEQAYVDRYGLSYEEAGIWARYVGQIWTNLEADFTLNGESEGLKERIQLLLINFPDEQLFWDTGALQVTSSEFRGYVQKVREAPLIPKIERIQRDLSELREEHVRR